MIKYDKRYPETVKKVIMFAQEDDFWRLNILSAEKLRKQYDMLKGHCIVVGSLVGAISNRPNLTCRAKARQHNKLTGGT